MYTGVHTPEYLAAGIDYTIYTNIVYVQVRICARGYLSRVVYEWRERKTRDEGILLRFWTNGPSLFLDRGKRASHGPHSSQGALRVLWRQEADEKLRQKREVQKIPREKGRKSLSLKNEGKGFVDVLRRALETARGKEMNARCIYTREVEKRQSAILQRNAEIEKKIPLLLRMKLR